MIDFYIILIQRTDVLLERRVMQFGDARLDIDHREKGGRVVSLRISLTHRERHTHAIARCRLWQCGCVCARARARADLTRCCFAEKFISDLRIRYRCITLLHMQSAGCFGNICVKPSVQ